MPATYLDQVKPELAGKFTYTEDGEYTKALGIPTYEWMPSGSEPKAVVLAIHGLTLHGRRFRVLARSLAVNGIGFISMDMRGFGRSRFDDKNEFSTKDDDRSKVNHEKSYEEIAKLAELVKKRYPDTRMVVLGESLGCSFAVRLASEHPDEVYGLLLSAPAVKVNRDMYAGRGQIKQGMKAVIRPSHELDLHSFFTELCSQREDVQKEMADDPLITKSLTLKALLSTDKFVAKTASWGKKTSPNLAVLILQGSSDGCVSPKHVTDLMNAMPSADQTLAWKGHFGHLQLETTFMRAATVDAIGNWMLAHSKDQQVKLLALQQNIADLGGTMQK